MCTNGYFHGVQGKFYCLVSENKNNICPYDASHPLQKDGKRKQDCPKFGKD